MMKFSEYIKKLGDEVCAQRWGVKARTVASWRRGERFPRPKQAGEIVRKEEGALSIQDIFGIPDITPRRRKDDPPL